MFIKLFLPIILFMSIVLVQPPVSYSSDSTSFTDNLTNVTAIADDIDYIGIVRDNTVIPKPNCPSPKIPQIFGAIVSSYQDFRIGQPFGNNDYGASTGTAAFATNLGTSWRVNVYGYGYGRPAHAASILVITTCRLN